LFVFIFIFQICCLLKTSKQISSYNVLSKDATMPSGWDLNPDYAIRVKKALDVERFNLEHL